MLCAGISLISLAYDSKHCIVKYVKHCVSPRAPVVLCPPLSGRKKIPFEKQIALQPEVYTPFRLQEKEELSHDTRMFRFALQSPKHVLGLPIGQHVSMKFVDKTDGKTVTRSYTPTSSDLNVRTAWTNRMER